MEQARTLIEVRHVHKVYDLEDDIVHALKDINLTIANGEFVSIVGQSGCGKSTLLNLLAGLDRPSYGEVILSDEVVAGPRSREVGYVFQKAVLLPWRTIMNNILLGAELMHLGRSELRDRAMDLLEMVGLTGFENRFPHQLSGGMQQRAAIVRALIHEPKVLLMDEPFGALDAITRQYLNGELLRIRDITEATIVFVTHDLREAAFLSDRVIVMSARPGGIRADIASPLPRERDEHTPYTPEFVALAENLNRLIA